MLHSTSGSRFVCNGPEALTDMVTFLPVVACVLYRGQQFGALGPLDIVHVAHYCAVQALSFSEICVCVRRSASCYKEH
jgi:hypothetical protein